MKYKCKYLFLILIISLVSASLACKLPFNSQPADLQPELVPVTTEAAEELREEIEEAAKAFLAGKSFTLTINEAQATSMVNLELSSIGEPGVSNLQIFLRDGQIKVVGDLSQSGLSLPVSIAMRVYADQGSIAYEIVEAKAGPFDLPDSITQELKSQLDQIILAQLNPGSSDFVIESITITDGIMTILGHAR
jgi:hypothetical protein